MEVSCLIAVFKVNAPKTFSLLEQCVDICLEPNIHSCSKGGDCAKMSGSSMLGDGLVKDVALTRVKATQASCFGFLCQRRRSY